ILHELNIVRGIFKQPNVSDNSADIFNANSRLKRIIKILEILVAQISVLETMTPLDFLDFRDLLRPASGFQSIQFKILEALLGLEYANRFGHEYYLSQLNEKDIKRVKDAEAEVSLMVLLNGWLERMPFANAEKYWGGQGEDFWKHYRQEYAAGLLPNEQANLEVFDQLFIREES